MPSNQREDLCDANKTCVRRHIEELWNNGQFDRIDDFFAKDFINFGRQYQDVRATMKHIVSVWRTAFPDLRFTVDSMVAEGDVVMCEASFQGTHLGEFQRIPPLEGPLPPTGKACRVKQIHRFRLKEGKIVEHFAVRDDLGMFQQLGHLGALGKRPSSNLDTTALSVHVSRDPRCVSLFVECWSCAVAFRASVWNPLPPGMHGGAESSPEFSRERSSR